jgi:hypothetical protein
MNYWNDFIIVPTKQSRRIQLSSDLEIGDKITILIMFHTLDLMVKQ